MQKMTSTVRDKTAKIERKVKKWRFHSIMDIFECHFYHISHIKVIILSHKCPQFCRIGSIQISEILFLLKMA